MINIFFSKLNIKTIQIILLIIGCILIIISLYCFNAYLVSESIALTNTTTTTTTINNKFIEKFNINTNTNTTATSNIINTTSNTINTTNTTPTTTSNITTPEFIIPSTTLISYADTINNNIPQSGMTSSINNNNNNKKKHENLEPNLTTVGTNLYVSPINNNVVNNKIKSDVFPLIRIE